MEITDFKIDWGEVLRPSVQPPRLYAFYSHPNRKVTDGGTLDRNGQ
jgi:hypothetical protein